MNNKNDDNVMHDVISYKENEWQKIKFFYYSFWWNTFWRSKFYNIDFYDLNTHEFHWTFHSVEFIGFVGFQL